ncbi:MAG: SAM-dependent methyltransferase, partial [Pseudomonadota bacterium]|nr:SAM-dependent methyltransferase [Pseudomonadota bacterium]
NRRRGLIGRTAWQALRQRLELLRGSDGRLSLTFEVIYGHAFRPVPTVTARGESIIRLDFPRKG